MPHDIDKHDIRKYVDTFLDKYIFGSAPKVSAFEKDLKQLTKEISIKAFKLIQLFSVVILILMLQSIGKFSGVMSIALIAAIAGVIVLLIWSSKISSKTRRAKNYLQRALKTYKTKDYVTTMNLLLDAYEILKIKKLWNLIISLAQEQTPTLEQQSRIAEFEYKKDEQVYKNDKKLAEIMQQIITVGDYIKKHGDVISNSWNKISELKLQLQGTSDNRLLSEYNSLIKRYEDIVGLEQSKIEFYTKAKNELLKLKENHLITQKLIKEKEELLNLEDSILEKSIHEEYTSDMSVNDFIVYENAYLDAIKEYSETISTSANHNLFEEITQNFKDKTKLL